MTETPTEKVLIDAVIRREGGSTATNDPQDGGGRTQYGISEWSFPKAWADGKVTEQEAREIYLQKFVVGPGFSLIPPSHARVQAVLVDWGVNSGPMIAIQNLQRLLVVPVDGVFGQGTLAALVKADAGVLANKLCRERVKMIVRVVQRSPSQLKFLGGWIERALSFLS